jgi:hypothetical protein
MYKINFELIEKSRKTYPSDEVERIKKNFDIYQIVEVWPKVI